MRQTHEDPRIVAAAERRMRSWVLAQQLAQRATGSRKGVLSPVRLGPYVAISREAGAGGSEIAQSLGRKLGWDVLDKNLLDRVANRRHLSREALELVDETPGSWVYDVLGTWLDPELIPHEKYVAAITRVLLAAARRGRVVLVGRGAPGLLPREGGLAVRIIAPEHYRLEQIMQQKKLDAAAARMFMERTDRGRARFVQQYFHHDSTDPHLYDLVINVEHIGAAGAVEQILLALGPQRPA